MRQSALVLLFLACALLASAQEPALRPEMRQELWLSAAVRGRAPQFMKDLLGDHYKKLRLSGELGYRSADNFFAGRQIYTDLGARYKINDLLSLGMEYRYAWRGQQADRQRIGLSALFGKSFDRFDLGYRFMYQREFRERDRQQTVLRNRFSVDYNIRKWKLDPGFSIEFFTRTDRPDGWYRLGTRYKLGTTWSPSKAHSFGPAIIYDRDGQVNWPANRVVWSVDYVINLRRL